MVLCVVWSSAFIFVELALRDAPAEVFTAQRALAAAPVLAAALLIRDATGLTRALRQPRVHVIGAFSVAGFLERPGDTAIATASRRLVRRTAGAEASCSAVRPALGRAPHGGRLR